MAKSSDGKKLCRCGLEKGHKGACKTGRRERHKPFWKLVLEATNPPKQEK